MGRAYAGALGPLVCGLIVARSPVTGEIKYFVSNAPPRTALTTLMKVAFTRAGIEHPSVRVRARAVRRVRHRVMRTTVPSLDVREHVEGVGVVQRDDAVVVDGIDHGFSFSSSP